ncbi:hypothetical protein [endosymbiont GvMRE of Glomus versiforme]|uniref:hypothetical protein n=1 Tax=endosymbiont GvMRE of Glomus versiforme TaxID=2039283 RepID=UPI0011C3BA64|nr:hypothetical protein [endosymbiont GvMRE of Glomus versiforme]
MINGEKAYTFFSNSVLPTPNILDVYKVATEQIKLFCQHQAGCYTALEDEFKSDRISRLLDLKLINSKKIIEDIIIPFIRHNACQTMKAYLSYKNLPLPNSPQDYAECLVNFMFDEFSSPLKIFLPKKVTNT